MRHGTYEAGGKRIAIKGDVSKLSQATELDDKDKALLQNYHFLSGMLAGTRQLRRRMRNLFFCTMICYGVPIFVTYTPSERHNGLAIRLYRGRRNDPAYHADGHDAKQFAHCIGYNGPSLESDESVTIELPEYDLRRLITARDPLCCVHAFLVLAKMQMPLLYGFRMCPNCPHCVEGNSPCMDRFGSNATALGGAAGGADGMIGAVEAQQAEGVLHLHFFLYLQQAGQFRTLQEVASMIEKAALSVEAMKSFQSYVRCATLPDAEK